MNRHAIAPFALVLFAIAGAIGGGCSSGGLGSQSAIPSNPGVAGNERSRHHQKARPQDSVIQHVVIVIQENRSFNNIFGGPNPFPNASTSPIGYNHLGTPVPLTPVKFDDQNTTCDIDHYYADALAALNPNGSDVYQMNGFDQETMSCGGNAGTFPYKYVTYSETKPYWFMASHWALADHFYPTELGPSFTAHLNLIAGTDEVAPGKAAVDFPTTWGFQQTDCESVQGATVNLLYSNGTIHNDGTYPCFWQFHSMADLLDTAHLSWRYYAPTVSDLGGRVWSEYAAIEQVRCGTHKPINSKCTTTGPDWANVITPENKVLTDIGNGVLKNVTWVVPTFGYSDHELSNSEAGPYWVASIVNKIGKSKFWNSTVIAVLWDDWGGWYDEVAPPRYDFRGKAIRTPLIVIAPYTKTGSYYYGGHGWLSHWVYEPGSILRFIEDVFGTGRLDQLPCYYYCMYGNGLGYTDSTAQHGIADNMLDTTQTPRPFTPVPTPPDFDESYFVNHVESAQPPDTQ